MPVATFAEFLAEQAIAITIGAAAVVAAPKAGPKLAELGNNLGAKAKSMIDSTQASSGATQEAAAASQAEADPTGQAAAGATAVAAGRSLAEKLAGGAQKLGQQWGALFAEVAADNAAPEATAPSLASVLAGLSAADVVSQAPGRVRLRLSALRGQPQLAGQLAEALAAVEGIRQVQPNPTTGSVLILLDDAVYLSPDALLEAIAQR
jgi:hypothetical protein